MWPATGWNLTLPWPYPLHLVCSGPLCNSLLKHSSSLTLWTKCSTLLMEMSALLPAFKKLWLRCLNLNIASALQSQRTCEVTSNTYLHVTPGTINHRSLSSCPFEWHCPDSSLIIILSWFLLKLSNSPAVLAEGVWRKSLACLFPWKDCQYTSCLLFIQSDHSPGK